MASPLDPFLAPLRLPWRVLEVADAIVRAARAVEAMEDHLARLEHQVDPLDRLPGEVNRLGDSFDGSNRGLERLREEMVELRGEVVGMRRAVESASDQVAGISRAVGPLERDIAEISDVVEPLQPAADRVGRLAERLPGRGRRSRD